MPEPTPAQPASPDQPAAPAAAQPDQRDARIAELEVGLVQIEAVLEAERAQVAATQNALVVANERIGELESTVEDAAKAISALDASLKAKDQIIDGIAPDVYEKVVGELAALKNALVEVVPRAIREAVEKRAAG